jgi:CelD/BcsL family acetyltransferase involved in cellulose biosynthesis
MQAFFEFHAKRWRKRGLPGAFVGARSKAFHRDWAQTAAKAGWLRLGLLTVAGQPAGAIYAMAMGRATYFYQSGFVPGHSSLSPGTLLVAHTIREAIAEGRPTFDFMRGDEPYKRRWKPQSAVRNLRLLLPGDGALSRFAKGWNGAGFRVESRLRARLEGRGLVG